MFEEYRRSLKMPAAEEVFDLVFYRPLAFVFVKGIYRLPITPNQVTMASMLCGLVAAWYFSVGNAAALAWAAVWYVAANILDCADGQLARLQQSGTPLGRLVDGVADYISSIAIFIGIGIGLTAIGQPQWLVVILAGVSSAAHAVVFDHYQSEYIAMARGEKNFTQPEREKISSQLRSLESLKGSRIKVVVLKAYLRYLMVQQGVDSSDTAKHIDAKLYSGYNSIMIRLWSVLGPTTNRTALIVFALFARVDLFLWGVVIVGNFWLVVAYILQRRIHRRMEIANEETAVVHSIQR